MTEPHDADESRIEQILERWFELQQDGVEPELAELAKDAPHLIQRVRAMLDQQGELLGPIEAAASRRPLPIDRLGDFELKSRIGSGGMGDVYLARETGLDRMVAVKVLRRELADDQMRRLRFKREAQLTAALDHPNIVPIYGTGEDQGYVFLVMKLLPGASLDRVPGTWQPRQIAAIGSRIARALHAAHEVGIVHRDVKPGNIQVDGEQAWVLDFGLARGRVDLTLTGHGEAPGTLAYMPPEQLRDGPGQLDPRGDVYSLAATLYQTVSGHPPFQAESPEVLVRQALLHDPEPLRLEASDRDFWTILQRALEKNVERRFTSALALAEDLDRFVAGEPIESRPPSTLTRCVKLARRHRTAFAALCTALLVLLVLLPKLWWDAIERADALTVQFDAVRSALAADLPATALGRLRELGLRSDARSEPDYQRLLQRTRATLQRDALLDRIQLDCVYLQTPTDIEVSAYFEELPAAMRAEPMTLIGGLFLARAHGATDRVTRITHQLGATNACPRLVTALLAQRANQDPCAAIAATSPGTLAVEDQVFTAVLLRLIDAPSSAVHAEIEAALSIDSEHPRARLMLAIRHMIDNRTERADEILRLLVDRERPRPEVQAAIAALANVAGRPDLARKHVELARDALRATERAPNRWIALQEVLALTLSGQLAQAEDALSRARAKLGDDEWFAIAGARLQLASGEQREARETLGRLLEQTLLPYNRRRASTTVLQLDVRLADELSLAGVEAMVERARALADEASAVGDKAVVVDATLVLARLAGDLRAAFAAGGLEQQAKKWDACYWDALQRVLATEDLQQEATRRAAQYVANWITDVGNSTDEALVVGAHAAPLCRRAVSLTRSFYFEGRPIERPATMAALAALLSVYLDDEQTALQTGAIAAELLRGEIEIEADRASIETILAGALRLLDRLEWPSAPATSKAQK